MNNTASQRLSTKKASAENGIMVAVMAATSQSSQRKSLLDKRSARRPTSSRPRTPVNPLVTPYCTPTSPSDIPRARIKECRGEGRQRVAGDRDAGGAGDDRDKAGLGQELPGLNRR